MSNITDKLRKKFLQLGITDKLRKKILQLGIVAATMAPAGNANASNETSKDNYNNIETVTVTKYHSGVYQKDRDSTITNTREQTLRMVDSDEILEHHQQVYERTDMLDNGYMMIGADYMHYKNRKIKNHDDDLVLHTPDGRKINCGFLNKFNFTTPGSIIDIATGKEEIITEEYAKAMNDINEQRAEIAIRKKIKNPEDRQAITQYIHRVKEEADNFMNREHSVEIATYTETQTNSLQNPDEKIKEKTIELIKNNVRDFR